MALGKGLAVWNGLEVGVDRVRVGMSPTSESNPGAMPTTAEDVPGGAKTLTSQVVGTAAGLVQDLTPVKQFQEVGYVLEPLFLFQPLDPFLYALSHDAN